MNRREFLQCAAILVSGGAISNLGFALSDEQMEYLASAPNYISQSVNFFTPLQRQLVAAMAETIIPKTDSPGAIDAGVPKFIELMVANWMNDQERNIFMSGLGDMEERIPREFGKPFHELAGEQQIAILEGMEAAAADSPWYQRGNVRRAFISDAPFFCMAKELIVWGFFTSEAGASEVLRYNPMPMRFDGDVPLSPDESSWAPYMFMG